MNSERYVLVKISNCVVKSENQNKQKRTKMRKTCLKYTFLLQNIYFHLANYCYGTKSSQKTCAIKFYAKSVCEI